FYGGGALGAAEVEWAAGVGDVDDEEVVYRGAEGEDVHRREFAVGGGGQAAVGGHVVDVSYEHAAPERADTTVTFRLRLAVAHEDLVERVDTPLVQAAGVVLRFDGAGVTRIAGGRERGLEQRGGRGGEVTTDETTAVDIRLADHQMPLPRRRVRVPVHSRTVARGDLGAQPGAQVFNGACRRLPHRPPPPPPHRSLLT